MKTFKLSKKSIITENKKFILFYWILNSIPIITIFLSLSLLSKFTNTNLNNFIYYIFYFITFIYFSFVFLVFIPSRNNRLRELKSINLIINNNSIVKTQKNQCNLYIQKNSIKSINITKKEIKILRKNCIPKKIILPFEFQDYNNLKKSLLDFSKL